MFQNGRSSRETELAENYPIQVVCSWIGNSPNIAAKHYLQITEDHFEKAVQFPVQNTAVWARTDSHEKNRDLSKPFICKPMQKETIPCESTESSLLGAEGFEQTDVTPYNIASYEI